MVFVFNKKKIYTYLVSVVTVVILFCMANILTTSEKSVQTSSNSQKLLPIYNVKTDENKVALTMNCAW